MQPNISCHMQVNLICFNLTRLRSYTDSLLDEFLSSAHEGGGGFYQGDSPYCAYLAWPRLNIPYFAVVVQRRPGIYARRSDHDTVRNYYSNNKNSLEMEACHKQRSWYILLILTPDSYCISHYEGLVVYFLSQFGFQDLLQQHSFEACCLKPSGIFLHSFAVCFSFPVPKCCTCYKQLSYCKRG